MNREEILNELRKIAEKMARGWDSEWKLKEIYNLIMELEK